MSVAEIKEELVRLTSAERVELLEAIWDSLEVKDQEIESPPSHERELESREKEIAKGAAKFIPWEEAKAQITNAPREVRGSATGTRRHYRRSQLL